MTQSHGDNHLPLDQHAAHLSNSLDKDHWRSLMADFIHLFCSFFLDMRYWEGTGSGMNSFDQLMENLKLLQLMPKNEGYISVRYQGAGAQKGGMVRDDYVIRFGALTLDSITIASMVQRKGVRFSHLTGRLSKAFNVLQNHRLYNLFLEMSDLSPDYFSKLKVCLEVISHFKPAIQNDSSIIIKYHKKNVTYPMIRDVDARFDPNLTMLAVVNRFAEEKMNQLIRDIQKSFRESSKGKKGKSRFIQTFQLIFRVKSLKGQLIKPPLEVNRESWMRTDQATLPEDAPLEKGEGGDEFISPYGEHQSHAMIYQNLSQFLKKMKPMDGGEEPHDLRTLFDQDYAVLNPTEVGDRLEKATRLLSMLETTRNGSDYIKPVISHLEDRLSQVNESLWKQIDLKENYLHLLSERSGETFDKPHDLIGQLISTFKARSKAYNLSIQDKKILSFSNIDYEKIAKQYEITPDNVKEIMALIKKCFDEKKHFLKKSFEQTIPEFMKYEKIIFEFLWSFLRETIYRADRVVFLNSLQKLIDRLAQPKRALKYLINDICSSPLNVFFSDRNAFILANLLVRKYNKELHVDIELTPEEVLLVENGLDKDVIGYGRWRLNADERNFSDKLSTIHQRLLEALEFGGADDGRLSARFLISLEREAFIFLSLTGGKVALRFLSNTMAVYSNPHSKIYSAPQDDSYLSDILNHLKLILRSLGRIGGVDDTVTYERFINNENTFLNMTSSPDLKEMIKRSIRQAEVSIRKIAQRQK